MSAPASPFDDAIHLALATLLRVGTALAEQLAPACEECPLADRAAAFESVGRCVRQTVLLCEHVTAAHAAAEARRVQARKEVARRVEDSIDRNARPEQVETLRRELRERMERPEFELDLVNCTPAELIHGLIHDLRLIRVPARPADPAGAEGGDSIVSQLTAARAEMLKRSEAVGGDTPPSPVARGGLLPARPPPRNRHPRA